MVPWNGQQSEEIKLCDGRPSTSKTEDSIVEGSEEYFQFIQVVELSKTAVHSIVTGELKIHKICAKLMPKAFTPDHRDKVWRFRVTSDANVLKKNR
ncbi:hypothetical protein NPIL_675931 [Nephila pilipes]|uniref:Uncharacterized protein n=1 Tax=Nephila pilipes TaxID=299642 RepID=A0A8X6TEH8_NEPPI|nr:hypothetical protein NPIL_675931 [Nephila pilipes]